MELLTQQINITSEGCETVGFLTQILYNYQGQGFYLVLSKACQVEDSRVFRAISEQHFHLMDGAETPGNFKKACKMAGCIIEDFNALNGAIYGLKGVA